ncbi:MAG: efflux RND transporter permease subunit, partial [Bacteroidota bacterium]
MVEGAFILPTHVAHSKALSRDSQPNRIQKTFEQVMDYLRYKLYAPALRLAMNNKILTLSFFTGILIMSFGAFGGGIVKGTFFPVIERDDLDITLQMPAGTREGITIDWLNHIEESAWKVNERISEEFFAGEKEAIQKIEKVIGPSSYQGVVKVSLLEGENRDSLRLRRMINEIRKEVGPIASAEVVSYGAASFFGKPISVSLVGDNYEELNAATDELISELAQLTELSDVVDNNQEGLREINVKLKEKAQYLGLNLQEVVGQVRSGFFGSEVQRLQRGRD